MKFIQGISFCVLLLVQLFWVTSWFQDFDKIYTDTAFQVNILAMIIFIAIRLLISVTLKVKSEDELSELVGEWIIVAIIFLIFFVIANINDQHIIAIFEFSIFLTSLVFVFLIPTVVGEKK